MILKYKDMHVFDNYKTMKIIYNMIVQTWWGLRTSSMLWAGSTTFLA